MTGLGSQGARHGYKGDTVPACRELILLQGQQESQVHPAERKQGVGWARAWVPGQAAAPPTHTWLWDTWQGEPLPFGSLISEKEDGNANFMGFLLQLNWIMQAKCVAHESHIVSAQLILFSF